VSDATDRIEISEVLNRHQLYIDLQDAEGYASLYTEDGSYESPVAKVKGGAELAAMVQRATTSGFTATKRHFNGPAMIDVDDDKATAYSHWWVADHSGEHPSIFRTGTNRDELRRVDGAWRIVRRTQTFDSNGSGGKK
jgi:hypothetical protein